MTPPAFLRALLEAGPEPSYPLLPAANGNGETSVSGIFVVGEAAGTPLLKLGLNAGVELVDALKARGRLSATLPEDAVSLIVVGAGASGLGAAMRAHELGIRVRVLEAHELMHTVVRMMPGKHLLAEPSAVATKSSLWFEECTREQLLERWRAQITAAGLDVREQERVQGITREGELFSVTTSSGVHRAALVLLALGKSGEPRRLHVPGEEEHPTKLLHEVPPGAKFSGEDLLLVGGGDVACETALRLAGENRVTLLVRSDLSAAKKRNANAVQALAAEGRVALHLGAQLERFDARSATFKTQAGTQTIVNDRVFELIGADVPLGFFRQIGVRIEGAWDARRYAVALLLFCAVYSLYALKKYPETPYAWPFTLFIQEQGFRAAVGAAFDLAFLPFRWAFTAAAYEQMRATLWFQQGYLYSLAYTIVMGVFGYQALVRWTSKARDPRYQKLRYLSLISFQIVFFLAANVVAVQALSIQHAWRAWGLYQPWPLFFHTFHWWQKSDPRVVVWLFVGAGLLGTFVAIPLLSRNHGKRFCTWICGCGGLAETLGDRWRHLAPKGARSRAWEFQGFVVLLAALLVTLVSVGAYGTRADNAWAQAYGYIVDFWLVAVIPIALYPFFGGKVWCRYWCPLAAWNQILARWYGRLEIRSNDKCITCGECSKFCQVGVDVMAFARKADAFDNRNSSCIHCGICIDVCPMDVLSFGKNDRSKKTGRSLPVLPG
jgi:NosR/NirI family transcriptional regulator, nitrous oxide reductase regulator